MFNFQRVMFVHLFCTIIKRIGVKTISGAILIAVLYCLFINKNFEGNSAWSKRRLHFERVCEKGNKDPEENSGIVFFSERHQLMLNHMIVDDRYKILYCYVPKVACTNWKKMVFLLGEDRGNRSLGQIPSDNVHRDDVFVKLSDLSPPEIEKRIKEYTKFMFLREPFERLISAFRNKFEGNYNSSAYFKDRFGRKIIKKYRKGIRPEDVPQTGNRVKFQEFVNYIVDTNKQDPLLLNEHWAPFSNLCMPCHVNYDVIGNYSTIMQDSTYILKRIGAPSYIVFPKPKRASRTMDLVGSYISRLTPDELNDLRELYKDDFEFFNEINDSL